MMYGSYQSGSAERDRRKIKDTGLTVEEFVKLF